MSVVYLMAGILGGVIAAISSSAMGRTAMDALLMYSASGVICTIVLAMAVPKQRNDHRQD
ncbi:hypothetical protein [Pseudotabrizicola alkalilacus]|uniref:Uncharacterized protein n=1 Tax=Pseudotabrizicola alkalilacus TaxID=2305252 RepID=A0A411Z6J0_9RHOB|nr:hypothetical protein [Pseudotabrizicola alkalilacus]RGP38698.1 hypothetical protein D1012_00795 [Pseudotabrizicola alkalilacus]